MNYSTGSLAGQPTAQPHEYVRGGTAKLLLFCKLFHSFDKLIISSGALLFSGSQREQALSDLPCGPHKNLTNFCYNNAQ